mgnify:CR=1 FL=1
MEENIYKIAIASDHRGVEAKNHVKQLLQKLGHAVTDLGTNSKESVDYPDYAQKTSESIAEGLADFGILICATGIGMSIAANRGSHIRAALCYNHEVAKLSRAHNNANILVLGSNISSIVDIKKIVKSFLKTDFEGGRHIKRLEKIR